MPYMLTVTDDFRVALFQSALGTNTVPVTTLAPLWVKVPSGETRPIYLLDLAALDPAQAEKLVALIASTSNRNGDEIRETMIAIVARDVTIQAINQFNRTLDVVFPSPGMGGG